MWDIKVVDTAKVYFMYTKFLQLTKLYCIMYLLSKKNKSNKGFLIYLDVHKKNYFLFVWQLPTFTISEGKINIT